MTLKENLIEILNPQNQLNLYGYNKKFKLIADYFDKNKMPKSILFSGQKGIGKATFAYHIVNYLLSKNESNNYSLTNFFINEKNQSYRFINNNTHSNFFLIDNVTSEKDIKIEQVRELFKFINKSTYKKDLKIVLIDNADKLNVNSANALLKTIEDPGDNTFFIIIHDDRTKILETLKSRCIEFKFSLSVAAKQHIFESLLQQYNYKESINIPQENFYYESPGNLIRYIFTLQKANIDIFDNELKTLIHLIDSIKKENKQSSLSFISYSILKFYNRLLSSPNKYSNINYFNCIKIIKMINDMKKFNLDEKNTFFSIKNILLNETK